MAVMRERISCTSSHSMLTLPEKAVLVKLYYQNEECASAALRSYRHTKGIRRGNGPLTNAGVARMISKFEMMGCLDDRPRSGRLSSRRNAAETVKDEMETVAQCFSNCGERPPGGAITLRGRHEHFENKRFKNISFTGIN
ncbi:DUF4817 domain-containing protein [Trichonephila clavipes]|nr:DUF4817 domain-containing protein [Trichonephila clavipes]